WAKAQAIEARVNRLMPVRIIRRRPYKAAPTGAVQALRQVKTQAKKNPAEAGFFMKHQANYLD
ncbi:hypothetical protein Q1J61_27300, partial [Pseudomonas putida]|uniref:hypothetical protein n=1 Tax=Pseudomonas putida TaxID=303 RepID=UPI0034D664FD